MAPMTKTLSTRQIPVEGLHCVCCAESLEHTVRALPGVEHAEVDFATGGLAVAFDHDEIAEADLRQAVRDVGYRCADEDDRVSAGELGHRTQMTPITCCTTHDRMQYELPHTTAAHEHTEPGAEPHHGHGGMDHDMSDPTMAEAMERDMRNRFFVALALTIPVILFSPLAVNTFGIELLDSQTARNL